jgi:microcystin-dependent protein
MSQPYLGEIKAVSFCYEPRGWLYCDGQSIPIGEYLELFSLIGTTYGGNGTTHFKLPDLNNKMILGTTMRTGETTLLGENTNIQIPNLSIPSQSITFTLRNVTVI